MGQVAYDYFSLSDLFDSDAELKSRGITPNWSTHHGVTVSMYYGDADGNQMELQVDCFAVDDDANAFMIRAFATNPIGVEYHPDEWLAEVGYGTPIEDLRTAVCAVFAPQGG